MTSTFLAAFVVFLLAVVAMSLGVMLQGKRITGSCGGMSAIDGVDRCVACGRCAGDGQREQCKRRQP